MEAADDTYPIPAVLHEHYPHAFLLRVEGHSMDRMLPDGCLALVDPCNTIDRDNAPYAVSIDERAATIKRVHKTPDGFELVPDSTVSGYQTQAFTSSNSAAPGVSTVAVVGRVVWHCMPR